MWDAGTTNRVRWMQLYFQDVMHDQALTKAAKDLIGVWIYADGESKYEIIEDDGKLIFVHHESSARGELVASGAWFQAQLDWGKFRVKRKGATAVSNTANENSR